MKELLEACHNAWVEKHAELPPRQALLAGLEALAQSTDRREDPDDHAADGQRVEPGRGVPQAFVADQVGHARQG